MDFVVALVFLFFLTNNAESIADKSSESNLKY